MQDGTYVCQTRDILPFIVFQYSPSLICASETAWIRILYKYILYTLYIIHNLYIHIYNISYGTRCIYTVYTHKAKHATSAFVHKAYLHTYTYVCVYIYIYIHVHLHIHTYIYTCNLLIIRNEARGCGLVSKSIFNCGSLLFQRPWEVLRISGSGLHLLASRRQRNALLQ